MENYSLVEEGNNQRSGSTAPVSKSVGSLVKIDSISIDLRTAKEKKEAEKCHHFSIRGYVADKRNKDIKICAPFPLDGNETELRKQLEPLHVAKYKWWRCQSCAREIIAASASDELPDSQETSPNMNGDESYPSFCCHEKEKHSSVERTAVRGTAAMESKGSDLVPIREPNPGIGEAENTILAIEYPGCKGTSPAEICPTGKDNPLNEEQRNSLIACKTSKEVLNIDETTCCAVKDAAVIHPSLELKERDSDSFKCDEKLAEDNRHTKHYETSIGLPCRKTRKVRLITDLLKDKGNVESNQISFCNAVSNALAELASSSDQRKRKMPQEPSREMSCPNNLVKKVRASNGDVETTIKTIEISDSESEKDASAGIGFRSYMPLQQTGKMPCSTTMKNKMPQGEEGLASSMLQKSMLGENSRENIGLDLSLNSYMDVENKSNTFFPQKNSMPDNDHWGKDGRCIGKSSASDLSFGKDVLSDVNERIAQQRGIPRQQQNSTLSLHNKLDFPLQCSKGKAIESGKCLSVEIFTEKRSENVSEQKSSDEVPMEIVELMAKNQYERGLSEAKNSSGLSKGIANRYERGLYEMREFGPVNGMMRLVQKEHKKWNPVNFSHANSNFAKTSTSRTIINSEVQNHLWNGDKMVQRSSPTRIQGLDAYKTSHAGPQQYGKGGNILSFGAPGNRPAQPNISQKLESQTSNIETHSQRPELHKGKKVRDLDLNIADPNATDLETSHDYPVVTKDVGLEPNRKDMGSLDSFSNETIPAMQLLSLMYARMQSRASFRVDAKKILEKPLIPCDNHPKFSMDGRLNLLEKPLFPHNRQAKEFSGLGPATCKAGGSARQMPSGYNGQEFARPQEADKAKRSFSPAQNKDWRSRKAVSTSGVSDTIRDSNPRLDKQKGILGASDAVVFPLQHQSSTNYIDAEASHMNGTIKHLISISETLNCVVNKNPADFSNLDAGNEYMIRVEYLRLGKKDYCGSKTGWVDEQKRERVPKFTAPKVHVQSQRP